MTDKEKIREEVERIFKENRERCSREGYAVVEQLRKVLAFIDSLQEEPVSNDLEEAADKHLVEKGYLLTTNNGEHLAEVEAKGLFKAGAQWQKERILNNATEREVKVDVCGYPYIDFTELYDYDKDIPLAKEGDKVKLVIIRENNL